MSPQRHIIIKLVITIASSMPRMSLAEEFYNDEDEHDNDGAKWLIIYDFSCLLYTSDAADE